MDAVPARRPRGLQRVICSIDFPHSFNHTPAMSFKSAAKSVAKKSGVSMKSANAIIASASRNASAAAKKANPKLKRVKG